MKDIREKNERYEVLNSKADYMYKTVLKYRKRSKRLRDRVTAGCMLTEKDMKEIELIKKGWEAIEKIFLGGVG